jgi:hypothetical protein
MCNKLQDSFMITLAYVANRERSEIWRYHRAEKSEIGELPFLQIREARKI